MLPTFEDLKKIADLFKSLQMADSPLEKLEFLLSAIAHIFNSVSLNEDIHVGQECLSCWLIRRFCSILYR